MGTRTIKDKSKNRTENLAKGKNPVEISDDEVDSENDSDKVSEEESQPDESDQEAGEDADQSSEDEEEGLGSNLREIEVVQPVRKQNRTPPLRPNQKQLLKILKWMRFTGTRYPHQDTLRELGLKRDVEYLMEMCGLATLMSQRCGAFKEETCQFLSSFELHFYEDEPEVESDGGLGYLTFTVNGEEYSLTTNQLDTLYGFPSGQDRCREFEKNELLSLWKTIGDKAQYASKSSKSAQIRSPVIRYLHKSIAHTFFARKITGNVNERELQFLDTAIGHVSDYTSDGVALAGDTSDTGLTVALLDQFLYYRSWAATMYKKKVQGELSIGGLVTPILVACGIDLMGEEHKPKWIDIPYLTKSGFLDKKKMEGRFVYKFHHPLTDSEVLLPLPCVEYTKIRDGRNVDFYPPLEMVYDASYVPAPQRQNRASDDENEDEDANSDDQFDFEDYTAPRQGAAVQAAHKNIGLLRKWNKYQGKVIKTLKNAVSEMKEQIKELQRKMSGSSPRATRDEGATPVVIARSRSLLQDMKRHFPMDPPRSSSFEPRETRGSRKRRAMQSPSRALASSSRTLDPHVELGTGAGSSSRSGFEQHSVPTYSRESMDASIDSFFSHP